MALPDLTGINIENSYQRVVHTDGVNYYNGTGSLLNLGPINTGSFATTGSNRFNGNQTITGSLVVTQGANVTLSTGTGILYRNGIASVDWRTRTLNNEDGNVVVDWSSNQTLDTLGSSSIDWEQRILNDANTLSSVEYNDRRLRNSGNNVTLNWETGDLVGTASYATQALSASYAPATPAFPFIGSAQITGSLSVSGSLVINNVDIQSTIVAMAIALG